MGNKGQGKGWQQVPQPSSFPAVLPPSRGCCPGLCPVLCPPLGQPGALWQCRGQCCPQPCAGCVLPAPHSCLLPSTGSTVMAQCHTMEGTLLMPFCPSPLPAQGLLHNPAAGAEPFAVPLLHSGALPLSAWPAAHIPSSAACRAMPGCHSAGAPDRSGVGCLGGCRCWWWGVGRALRAANCCLAGDTEGVIMGALHECAAWPGEPTSAPTQGMQGDQAA